MNSQKLAYFFILLFAAWVAEIYNTYDVSMLLLVGVELLMISLTLVNQYWEKIEDYEEWRHQGGGAWGGQMPPQLEALPPPPLAPPVDRST